MMISIKRAVAGLAFGVGFACAVHADTRQPCPPLEIEQSCRADGAVALTLRAGAKAPANLSYIISLQAPGQRAVSLAPGASQSLRVDAPKGQQVTLAVVGLEPDGADMAACCLSNQRVHLPASCAAPDTPQPVKPALTEDLSIDLSLTPDCSRDGAGVRCSGTLQISGADVQDMPVTLSTDQARRLKAAGADCTDFTNTSAICRLSAGQPLPFDLHLPPNTPKGTTQLCAQIGVPDDGTSRTLALQQALDRAGYRLGKVDGDFGPATKAALATFVEDAGLPPMTVDIPPEALALLGVEGYADTSPANNLACAQANVPKPPLICDTKTTRANGETCACRFKGMVRASAASCVCPKGQELGPKGCAKIIETTGPENTNDELNCDPATTVLRKGKCRCRAAGMVQVNATTCREGDPIRLCPNGLPELPGIGCLTISTDGRSGGPRCSKVNEAGECCDDLPRDDPSCQ